MLVQLHQRSVFTFDSSKTRLNRRLLSLQKRAPKTTEAQYLKYVEFLEQHPNFVQGSMSSGYDEQALANDWAELVELLNAVPGGPNLTKVVWQNRFQEWRYSLNAKQKKLVAEANSTGGGPPTAKPLKEHEERALEVFGSTANTGDPALLQEAGIVRLFRIPTGMQPVANAVIEEIVEVVPVETLDEAFRDENVIPSPNPNQQVDPDDDTISSINASSSSLRQVQSFGGANNTRPTAAKRTQSFGSSSSRTKRRRQQQTPANDCLEQFLQKMIEIEEKKAEEQRQFHAALQESFNTVAVAISNLAAAISGQYIE